MSQDLSHQFIHHLAEAERSLSLYVYGLVSSQVDADDILQQSKLIMWKNFDQFQVGTNFLAWARKIAFHQILNYRRKSKRQALPLSEDILEQVGQRLANLTDHHQERREALESCLHRLKDEQRQMILLRYREELDIDQISEELDSTPTAIYRALSRIRLSLADCIRKQLAPTSITS